MSTLKSDHGSMPARFIDLKRSLAPEDSKDTLTRTWHEVLAQLSSVVDEIVEKGPTIVPQVEFAELHALSGEVVENIKRKGCVVVKNVVDDEQAKGWKDSLENYVKANPQAEGFPADNKQFFMIYWAQSQIAARSHPNVLKATAWLNNLYHAKSGKAPPGVDLNTPLAYADRFRIRHPGGFWDDHPPHIDGGSIERWEDPAFRTCFEDILNGNWEKHDPYDLEGRLNAKTSLYGRPNQSSVFRTFQGWLALSETAPTQGTLKVFPSVHLSNAYLILRPFFKPGSNPTSENLLDAQNWEYDTSSPEFPGIFAHNGDKKGYYGPRLSDDLHPHLKLESSMTSVPKVNPGDMVFWHCDVVHSVEREHTGSGDTAVMYIPAVPLTPANLTYVKRQKESFMSGIPPPDFPKGAGEGDFVGRGRPEDIFENEAAKFAMGFNASF